MEPSRVLSLDQAWDGEGRSTDGCAVHDDDGPGFWALMFWKFHGLDEKDTGRFIGEALAARYGGAAHDLPPALDDLLAQLEAAERNAAARRPNTGAGGLTWRRQCRS